MQSSSAKRLLVLGGNGFLGKAVCRAGLQKGWNVSSLARHGSPAPIPNDLLAVNWIPGSALNQESLSSHLSRLQPSYIVHSIGTLFESGPDRTYQGHNYETLRVLLNTIMTMPDLTPISLAYISANSFGPIASNLLPKYMDTKRQAEDLLKEFTEKIPSLKGLVLRPGVLYGGDRPATIAASLGFRLMTVFSAHLFPPPLQVDTMARFLCHTVEKQTDSFHIYECSEINA